MRWIVQLFFLLYCLAVTAMAIDDTSFCKCTCFKNSTIIPLTPDIVDGQVQPRHFESQDTTTSSVNLVRDKGPPRDQYPHQYHSSHIIAQSLSPLLQRIHTKRVPQGVCSACTKAFCLQQNIPFCQNAEEADVVTLCFQRDSQKDRIIVWGFILGTGGLLGWSLFHHFRPQSPPAAWLPVQS